MNALIQTLVILQDKDSKITGLTLKLKRIPAERQHILQQQNKRKENALSIKKQVQETEIAIKKLELDAGTRRTSITRLKTQQFETRKNDEFKTMGDEILRYEAEVEELELQELELLEELEKRQQNFSKAKALFHEVQSHIEEQLSTLEQRSKNLTAEVKNLLDERSKLTTPLEESIITQYERLMKSKGLPVVVPLDDTGHCGGCHSKVIRTTEILVLENKTLVNCEQCGRILY